MDPKNDETTKQEELEQTDHTESRPDEAVYDSVWDSPEDSDDEPSGVGVVEPEEALGEEDDEAPSEDKDTGDEKAEREEPAETTNPEGKDGEGEDQVQDKESSADEDIDLDEYRRLKAFKDSMQGRMDKLHRENAELKMQLEQKGKPKREATKQVEIEEGLKFLAEDFGKTYPHLVDLLTEDSKEGALVREALEEGGKHVAGILGDSFHQQRESETRQIADQRALIEHTNRELAQRHPEFASYILGSPDEGQKFRGAIERWISSTMNYSEGVNAMRILEEGSIEEVSGLLGQFSKALKAFEQNTQGGSTQEREKQNQASKKKREQHAADGAAVPTRRQPTKEPQAPPDDYDAAWDEAVQRE